jgi:hypothetical protein
MGEAIMSKAITKEDMALLKEASEMFTETGCVPGIDGEQVPAEKIVPDVKEYISETIDDPEAIYDPEIWDTPGFTLAWISTERYSPNSQTAPSQSAESLACRIRYADWCADRAFCDSLMTHRMR